MAQQGAVIVCCSCAGISCLHISEGSRNTTMFQWKYIYSIAGYNIILWLTRGSSQTSFDVCVVSLGCFWLVASVTETRLINTPPLITWKYWTWWWHMALNYICYFKIQYSKYGKHSWVRVTFTRTHHISIIRFSSHLVCGIICLRRYKSYQLK